MKRFLISVLVLGALAGCSSTPEEQKGAVVEEAKPGTGPVVVDREPVKPVDPSPTARGLKDDPFAGSPLRDPKSILSKRSIFFDLDSNLIKDEYKPVGAGHARYP